MILLIARTTAAELLRRRAALLLVVLLPLAFYLVRLGTIWTALRLLSIGLGWAVATLALFTHVGARDLDRRLVVAGASPGRLHLGRQLAVTGFGLLLAASYFLLVALTSQHNLARLAPVLLLLILTALIAAPLGALVAAVVPRDLEGALLLLTIMAVQVLVDPDAAWTRILPLWSTRELASYAVEPVGADYLTRGLLHAAVTLAIVVPASSLVDHVRLRTTPVPVLNI